MNGDIIAIAVAICWTLSALFFEFGSRRIGSLNLNLVRLIFGFLMLGTTLAVMAGHFFPVGADSKAWILISLSGLIGFVLGDYFLFASYTMITARFSQLFMTLAPLFTAIFSFLILRETLTWMAILGMIVTLIGIGISVFSTTGDGGPVKLSLPLKGCIYATIGAFGQGFGIVVSKLGMNAYEACYSSDLALYIPLASTQIRCITGIFCFTAIIIMRKGVQDFRQSLHNGKGLLLTFCGSIFGPFVGVTLSLLAVQHSNTAVASTIMAMVPVIILLPDKFLFKRKVSLIQALGAVIAVIGVSLFFV